MPTSTVTSVETANDGEVLVSTDTESPIVNEITIYGSGLAGATSVELDSGDDFAWVVSSISPSANSIIVNAYAFGSSAGGGSMATLVHIDEQVIEGPTLEVYFALPLMD